MGCQGSYASTIKRNLEVNTGRPVVSLVRGVAEDPTYSKVTLIGICVPLGTLDKSLGTGCGCRDSHI